MILGISGYATAGKDALAEAMWAYGWERLSFADKVKELAYAIGWDGKKDAKGRLLLVRLGHNARAILGEDVWVDAVLPLEQFGDSYYGESEPAESGPDPRALHIVTDVRYPNEAARVKKYGGIIVRIERPGVGPALDENGEPHVSETLLDDWPFDHIVLNGDGLDHLGVIARNLHRSYNHEGS